MWVLFMQCVDKCEVEINYFSFSCIASISTEVLRGSKIYATL